LLSEALELKAGVSATGDGAGVETTCFSGLGAGDDLGTCTGADLGTYFSAEIEAAFSFITLTCMYQTLDFTNELISSKLKEHNVTTMENESMIMTKKTLLK
jgi:hypothetical protein